ncbi:TIGR02594 family protein [Robertkochia solimangrovi]|uniref:C40 family peptidase n=1 Tax=Robertkochia solimangrovi TaxID=2213046 RepID=UPI00117FD114|nr:TIGR02594 family protein [Robertkochia solimangrovi]TRZ42412.1 hypothetical protein DMZ48_12925 [Robertkochia solimangrovi]
MSELIKIASSQIGVKEIAGSGSNPDILKYAEDCGFKHYTSDTIAWCSLFANWVAFKSGFERSGDLLARSWLNVGSQIESPEPGDIVVFWRKSLESKFGHVGFFTGFSRDLSRIYCLGGNQGDQVSITARPANTLLGFRRLRLLEDATFGKAVLRKGDTGDSVMRLQQSLNELGHNCGTSDGVFGVKTETALKQFQSTADDLEITGIFDVRTKDHLKQVLKVRSVA